MSLIQRPRMSAHLFIPLPNTSGAFDEFDYFAPVHSATWVSNDHNHADTLKLKLAWQDAGMDPRYIASAIVALYMGGADETGEWTPSDDNLQFVGRAVRVSRSASGEGDGELSVEVEFHDYTSFFLCTKRYATDGVPLMSEDLGQAWARICSNVPGAGNLGGAVELRGLDSPPVIGSAAAARFAKLGARVPVKPNSDAWAVWQQCVGMCGLISYFDRDVLVIATVTDYYTSDNPPRMIWGENILSFSEERNNDFDARGVGITSFDPLTGRALEAIYNPHADEEVAAAKLLTTKAAKKSAAKQEKKLEKAIDYFAYPGITDQKRLDELARRVWEERARQALEGHLVTCDMHASLSGADAFTFDLMSLRAGDTLEVQFLGSDAIAAAAQVATVDDRIALLEERGYTNGAATVLARNVQGAEAKPEQFYVKSVSGTLNDSEFQLEMQFCNKIDTSGAAVAHG